MDGPCEAAFADDGVDKALDVDGPGEAGLCKAGLAEACFEDDG